MIKSESRGKDANLHNLVSPVSEKPHLFDLCQVRRSIRLLVPTTEGNKGNLVFGSQGKNGAG